jgi:hypothetical protein
VYASQDLVTSSGQTYIALKAVPADTLITNTEFWSVFAAKGDAGAAGAGITWRGVYESGVSYSVNDAVSYEGASYVCKVATTALPTDASKWNVMAAKGTNGTNGATGAAGASVVSKGAYSESVAYAVLDVVSFNGGSYICKLASTGNSPTNSTYWDLLASKGDAGAAGVSGTNGAPIVWKGAYSSATAYAPLDAVSHNGQSYICKNATTDNPPTDTTKWDLMAQKGDTGAKGDKGDTGATGATGASGGSTTWKGAYSDTATYAVFDAVSFSGSSYVCIASHTNQPVTNATYWALLAQKGETGTTGATGAAGQNGAVGANGAPIVWRGAYSDATAYVVLDAVSYNGQSYICKASTTGNSPTDTTKWDLMAQKGADGTGGAGSGLSWKGAYVNTTAYVVSDAVSYEGSSYLCIQNSTGNLPTNASFWSLMASKGDTGTVATVAGATSTVFTATANGQVEFFPINGYTTTSVDAYSVSVGGVDQRPTVDYTLSSANSGKLVLQSGTEVKIGTVVIVRAYKSVIGTDGAAGAPIVWKGAYSSSATYSKLDAVSLDGRSYICKSATPVTNVSPTVTASWDLMADKGANGAAGVAGTNGTNGAAGAAGSLTIGTVSTGNPGSAAVATITGTAPNQVLNLTIPTGLSGAPAGTFVGNWVSGGTYVLEDVVRHNFALWCKVAEDSIYGPEPALNNPNWALVWKDVYGVFRGAFDNTVVYQIGESVTHEDALWVATAVFDPVNGGEAPSVSSTQWLRLISTIAGADGADAFWNYLGEYDNNNNTNYKSGDIVTFQGQTYRCKYDTSPGNNFSGPVDTGYWDLIASKGADGADGNTGAKGDTGVIGNWTGNYNYSSNYLPNDVVRHNGALYIRINSNYTYNISPTDSQGPELWSLLIQDGANGTSGTNGLNGFAAGAYVGEWDSYATYYVSNVVLYNENLYFSKVNSNSSYIPANNSGQWLLIPTVDASAVYAVTGSKGDKGDTGTAGTNGTNALWNYTGAYNSGAAYSIGDLATYDGSLWYRKDAHGGNVGDTPSTSSPYWDLIASKGEIIGSGSYEITQNGTEQHVFTVPVGVRVITIALFGGQGGDNGAIDDGGNGGTGGIVECQEFSLLALGGAGASSGVANTSGSAGQVVKKSVLVVPESEITFTIANPSPAGYSDGPSGSGSLGLLGQVLISW